MALGLTVTLAACAKSDVEYPSLAIRDVERVQGEFAPAPVTALEVPSLEVDLTGGLEARLASLVASAQDAHSAFTQIEPRVARLARAASGSAVGSDTWASAQVALAELDTARSQAAIPLAELDALYVSATTSASDRTEIEQARDRVIYLVAQEDAVLAELRSLLQ